ncbi:MAG TPA: DUF5011 domain-containing protein, partial [Bacteroidales bacterium]|nr:DUF5011 domain-containing protein [Bacteroidales bacterium]
VNVTVTDAAGRTAQCSFDVLVVDAEAPLIILTGNATEVVFLNTVYTDAGANATDNCDGHLTSALSMVNPVNTSITGTYQVSYDVNDTAGNPAVTVYRQVIVTGQPTIIGDTAVCGGASILYITEAGMLDYTWNIGGGSGNSSTNSILVNWGSGGIGTVSVNYTFPSNHYTPPSPTTLQVTLHPLPSVILDLHPTSACFGQIPVTLSGGIPLGGTYTGDGVSSGILQPHLSGIGTHILTYSYRDAHQCLAQVQDTFVVHAIPEITLASPPLLCSDMDMLMLELGSPSGGTYGGGYVINGSFDIPTAGSGNHTLSYAYADSNGCIGQESFSLTVNPQPAIACPGSLELCADEPPITLTGGLPLGGSYSGTGVTGNLFLPQQAGPGSHTLSYAIHDAKGCSNTCNFNLTVHSNPTLSCPQDMKVCADEPSFPLSGANLSGGTYSGPGVIQGNFDAATAGPGTHTITYVYRDAHLCEGSCSFTITVDALPVASMPHTFSLCEGQDSLILQGGTPPGGTYSGQGVNGDIFTPPPAGAGTYSLYYTCVNAEGCTASVAFPVTVYPLPILSCAADQDICVGADPVTLQSAPSGGTYHGSGISGDRFDARSAGPGFHTIAYAYTDAHGCSDSCAFLIGVGPGVALGPDTQVYLGDMVHFQPGIIGRQAVAFSWNPSALFPDPLLRNASALPIGSTDFILHVTDENGCLADDTMRVQVLPRGNCLGAIIAYDNDFQSPLTGYDLILTRTDTKECDTFQSLFNGIVIADSLTAGEYSISGTTARPWPWGGVNATDALVAMRHFVQLDTLSPFRTFAGNVNLVSGLNATDAGLIARRFAGTQTGFPLGDWVIDSDTLRFNGTQELLTRTYLVLASGDVNGSFVPGAKNLPINPLKTEVLRYKGPDGLIPLFIEPPSSIGALSAQFRLAEGSHLEELTLAPGVDGELVWSSENGTVNLAWFAVTGAWSDPDHPLLLARISGLPAGQQQWVSAGEILEINDLSGVLMPKHTLKLSLPEAKSDPLPRVEAFPNPSRNDVTIRAYATSFATYSLSILNTLGQRVHTAVACGEPGKPMEFQWHSGDHAPGTYLFELREGANGPPFQRGTLVLTK